MSKHSILPNCSKCNQPWGPDVVRSKGAVCQRCYREYLRQYRKRPENKERLYNLRKQYRKHRSLLGFEAWCQLRQQTKAQQLAERPLRKNLLELLSGARSAKAAYEHAPAKQAFDLDLSYLQELYSKQNGRCAMTKTVMRLGRNDLRAMSIDRIDSNLGHTKGNIQLVCQWVNFAKRQYTNEHLLEVLAEAYDSIREAQTIVQQPKLKGLAKLKAKLALT